MLNESMKLDRERSSQPGYFLKQFSFSVFGKPTDTEDSMRRDMNVGILLVKEGEDLLDISVVLEDQIILHGIRDCSYAVAMLMGLLYALNIDYPKELQYTFEVIQKVLMNIGSHHCSARVHGLRNRLLRKTV